MGISLALAVIASALLAIGLVLMKARAPVLPPAHGSQLLHAVLAWCRDPVWIGSFGLQCAGYALSVVALAGAPVSLVAVMMQGGVALFVLFAVLFLGERARAAEWAGIGGVLLAMMLLALSLRAGEAEQQVAAGALAAISVAILAAAAASGAVSKLRHNGLAAAIVSGLAFGLGSLYTKAITQDFLAETGISVFARIATDPYVYLIAASNISGLIVLQNAFHRARGIVVMPLSAALSNLVPILGGILAFGEHLPADPLAASMRVSAFALTIVAGALLSATREPQA